MWTCKVCQHQIEEEEDFCYHCGSDRAIAQQKAERVKEKRFDTRVKCLRCREVMKYRFPALLPLSQNWERGLGGEGLNAYSA